jgi:hypothetical protein
VPPLAHETWFEHGPVPHDWGFAGETATLLLLAGAVAVTVAVRVAARFWDGVDVPVLARMAPWMPFALRIHLAVSLVGLLSMGDYLSPAMDLDSSPGSIVLGVQMALVAIAMATGYRAREAAWLLVLLGPVGMLEFGVWPVLARVDLLGLAVFIIVSGAGAWSADVELGRERPPSVADLGRAVWALKLCVGAALIVVAFQEKLANPDLALRFLAERPTSTSPRAWSGSTGRTSRSRASRARSRSCSGCW